MAGNARENEKVGVHLTKMDKLGEQPIEKNASCHANKLPAEIVNGSGKEELITYAKVETKVVGLPFSTNNNNEGEHSERIPFKMAFKEEEQKQSPPKVAKMLDQVKGKMAKALRREFGFEALTFEELEFELRKLQLKESQDFVDEMEDVVERDSVYSVVFTLKKNNVGQQQQEEANEKQTEKPLETVNNVVLRKEGIDELKQQFEACEGKLLSQITSLGQQLEAKDAKHSAQLLALQKKLAVFDKGIPVFDVSYKWKSSPKTWDPNCKEYVLSIKNMSTDGVERVVSFREFPEQSPSGRIGNVFVDFDPGRYNFPPVLIDWIREKMPADGEHRLQLNYFHDKTTMKFFTVLRKRFRYIHFTSNFFKTWYYWPDFFNAEPFLSARAICAHCFYYAKNKNNIHFLDWLHSGTPSSPILFHAGEQSCVEINFNGLYDDLLERFNNEVKKIGDCRFEIRLNLSTHHFADRVKEKSEKQENFRGECLSMEFDHLEKAVVLRRFPIGEYKPLYIEDFFQEAPYMFSVNCRI